ncbi:stage II sporulation protein E [Alkalibacillus flavidus]|uniref:Stage II sporulation protein E n=1 Tax=Alkalibacillus flavidus TaxID=546021 RepID=A0ABV2KVY2_9BACI
MGLLSERLTAVAPTDDHNQSLWFKRLLNGLHRLMVTYGLLWYIAGLLLGRAMILSMISPFAIAFLAATVMTKRSFAPLTFLCMMLGALTISFEHAFFISLSGLLMLLIDHHWVRHRAKRLKWLAMMTGVSVVVTRLAIQAFEGVFSLYDGAMFVLEGILAGFLVMVFMQSYPFLKLQPPRVKYKVEEMICLMILVTAVLTGMVGLTIGGLAIEQMMAMYVVLLSALIAGATVGSAIGVMVGLMLSLASAIQLYQISLLALIGLLSGLLKNVNRYVMTLGAVVAAVLIGLYNIEAMSLQQLLMQTAVAIGVFIVTPPSLSKQVAKFIPGTEEAQAENEQYLQKVRDATAHRVERFSEMFEALSHSFASIDAESTTFDKAQDVDEYLSRVTEKTCQTCLKKHTCWVNQFDRTYPVLKQMMMAIEERDSSQLNFQMGKLRNFCVKSDQVVDQMRYEFSFYKANKRLKQQVKESRQFVSEQLNGVSEVMNNFAQEMVKEREDFVWHEQMIRRMLYDNRFVLEHLELFSIEKGNVDLEMTVYFNDYHGEADKIIDPLLSDLLDETVVVEAEHASSTTHGDRTFQFSSVKNYQLQSGVAHAAKQGNLLSGDTYMMLELGKSRFVLAISDGMGNGERAYLESSETLKLLKQILQSGINEQVALQSINSILSLRTSDEIYATLDLAVIDLQEPHVNFLKIGAMMSFIKRGHGVYPIESGNLPIGILDEFEVDPVYEQLKDGDLLVMVSDGILEAAASNENREIWLKRKIRELETEDPQAVADLILEETIRSHRGAIVDDMTVLVTKVEKSRPKWASFPSVATV